MTPRKPAKTDPFSWDGVENVANELIKQYDESWIRPRELELVKSQKEEHASNTKKLDELEDELKKITALFTEWIGSLKVIKWIIIGIGVPAALMVLGLFLDLLRWGATHDWKY